MSYNGSGTFVINTAGQPVVANTVISATVFNALTADLATGLSTCITKDGQTTITANIPFGSNKITGLGAATAATDAATLGQVQSTAAKLITVTGTDTITGTMSPALTAYAAGQLFYFIANAANTGAMTINIDGLGAKAITRDGSTALIAGDVNTGEIVVICYDGTRFQMINAANSFGNTTINGTLTVTGNTGLQANVSITSTLSVGGTFAVTGAATLGSTLSVTGKSDLPVVSTASMNAAVAVITTGTVTNLTSTSASIASMNAGVALLTNATVTTLTATGASIASANIGNLQFTAASIASINAGVAVITNLTATSASIASMNAGVALLTTATVTNLTATGASIASANAGNLQATGASVASANVGVALITTGTVTALTATGASIASANVGTAVVTGLTVTNASIASANAGTATLSGNLTLNGGTANGVLYLDGSKVATSGTALVFDGTNLGVGTSTPAAKLDIGGNTAATLQAILGRGVTDSNFTVRYTNGASGSTAFIGSLGLDYANGTWADMAAIKFYRNNTAGELAFFASAAAASGTEGMRLNTTGLGIGTSSPAYKVDARVSTSASIVSAVNLDASGNSNGDGSAINFSRAGNALSGVARISAVKAEVSNNETDLVFSNYAAGSLTEKMRIVGATGNVGIGTSSPETKFVVSGSGSEIASLVWNTSGSSTNTAALYLSAVASGPALNRTAAIKGIIGTSNNHALAFFTNPDFAAPVERMRITSAGDVGIGTSSPSGFLANKLVIATGGTANEGMTIYSSSNNGSIWFADATTGTGRYAGGLDYTHSDDTLIFYSAAQGNMRLNASGNLGLGVTPSAWLNTRAFDIGTFGAVSCDTATSGVLSLAYNAYAEGASTWKYKGAGAAGLYQQTEAHKWFTAASGTAGNTISFTQAMTLDASGQLALGRTSVTDLGSNIRTVDMDGTSGAGFRLRANGTNILNLYASSTAVYMAAPANVPIAFETNNTERARITSGGYFKASNTGSYVLSTGDYHELRQSQDGITLIVSATNASQTANVVEIYGARNTTNNTYYPLNYYNTGAAAYKFRVADSGDVTNTNGTYGTISDAKMKTDIVDAGSQWADIKALRFRKFKMKDDPSGLTQLGVVAQEVEQTSPGLVDEHADFEEVEVTDDEGNVKKERQPTGTTTKSVKTSILLMKAAVALQEAMTRIEKLEAEVAARKGA